jgi:hypothetical protein
MNLPPLIRALLWPLSVVYGAIVQLRAWLYARGWLKQKRLKGAVISVGNLTVGGTGKTPMVMWLAEKFSSLKASTYSSLTMVFSIFNSRVTWILYLLMDRESFATSCFFQRAHSESRVPLLPAPI